MNLVHASISDPLCDRILPRVSRTFALPIQALSPNLRGPVQTAYLLCRIVDCVEDQPDLPSDVRVRLFDAFDAAMLGSSSAVKVIAASGLGGTPGEVQLCANAERVFADLQRLGPRQRAAVEPHILEMSSGMREFSTRWDSAGTLQVADVPELESYCYFVAGTVGLLLDGLFTLSSRSRLPDALRRELSVQFGVGLQLVNILKDVAEDAQRQVCYLPGSSMAAHGLCAAELLLPERRDAGLALVQELCVLTWEKLVVAGRYTRSWEGQDGQDARAFCALPLLLAAHTLRLIESGEDVLTPGETPKLSRKRVGSLVAGVKAARGETRMRALLGSAGLY